MRFQVIPVTGFGTEDVVVATAGPDEGAVFTGTEDGTIHRIMPDGAVVPVARTGGRPLGLEWLPDGRLLVCDARRGLLAVDLRGGRAATGGDGVDGVEVLVGEVAGRAMRFCNNAAVAADGTVYFSDSSLVHPIDAWKAEMLEVTRTGRLLRRAPSGEVSVLVDGLAFANGVALAADGSFVVVAETAVRTLVRYWLTGPLAGTRDYLAEDLPGYPDNISRGSDGLVWVALASPRDPLVERLQTGPLWLRRQATRIPEALQPKPKRTIRVQAYDATGRVVHDLAVDDALHRKDFHMVTGVREHEGRIWLGSLHEPVVAVLTP